MRVIAWSPNLTAERAAAAGVEYATSKEELLKESDVLSIHMVLSEATRHLLKADDLALMKPSAFLINTSRGPIVDEQALIDVLKAGSIAGVSMLELHRKNLGERDLQELAWTFSTSSHYRSTILSASSVT